MVAGNRIDDDRFSSARRAGEPDHVSGSRTPYLRIGYRDSHYQDNQCVFIRTVSPGTGDPDGNQNMSCRVPGIRKKIPVRMAKQCICHYLYVLIADRMIGLSAQPAAGNPDCPLHGKSLPKITPRWRITLNMAVFRYRNSG